MIELRHFAALVSANYLWLGVNYEAQFKVYIPSLGEQAGANTILDVPIYGGFGAVLSLGYFPVPGRRKRKTENHHAR